MIVVDSHLDLAFNALRYNRDLKLSVAETRRQEAGMADRQGRGAGTVAFPELRRGEVALSFATVCARVQQPSSEVCGFRSHENAYGEAQGQLAYYRELRRQGVLRMIDDWPTLAAHLAEWQSGEGAAPLGIVLAMEGADPIVEPSQAGAWWQDGLRVVSLAHYGPSLYAQGTGCVGPLTPAGRELLAEMERLGMILDLSHLSDESFWEAIERFGGAIMASHSNCRALVPGGRQLSDDMLRGLIEHDGVIGSALDDWMLYPGWVEGETRSEVVSLEDVVDHLDHVCQLAGNARHAAIGSDLDGGYGTEQSPRDLDTIADLQKIPPLLAKRGYGEADVQAIMHGNWLRLLQSAWSSGPA